MSREDFIAEVSGGSHFQNYAARLHTLLDGSPSDMAREWGIGGHSRGIGQPGASYDHKGLRIGDELMTWDKAHALLLEIHGHGQQGLF